MRDARKRAGLAFSFRYHGLRHGATVVDSNYPTTVLTVTVPISFQPSNSASSSDHTANPNGGNGPPSGTHRGHTDLSILATRPPSTARQQIFQPHRQTHLIPQHPRPSRPVRCPTLCCPSRMPLQRGASLSRASRLILSKTESYSR